MSGKEFPPVPQWDETQQQEPDRVGVEGTQTPRPSQKINIESTPLFPRSLHTGSDTPGSSFANGLIGTPDSSFGAYESVFGESFGTMSESSLFCGDGAVPVTPMCGRGSPPANAELGTDRGLPEEPPSPAGGVMFPDEVDSKDEVAAFAGVFGEPERNTIRREIDNRFESLVETHAGNGFTSIHVCEVMSNCGSVPPSMFHVMNNLVPEVIGGRYKLGQRVIRMALGREVDGVKSGYILADDAEDHIAAAVVLWLSPVAEHVEWRRDPRFIESVVLNVMVDCKILMKYFSGRGLVDLNQNSGRSRCH